MGRVKAYKYICEQNNDERFGAVAQAIDNFVNEGFERWRLFL